MHLLHAPCVSCVAAPMTWTAPPTCLPSASHSTPYSPTCPLPAVQILDHVADNGGHDTFYGQVRLLAPKPQPTYRTYSYIDAWQGGWHDGSLGRCTSTLPRPLLLLLGHHPRPLAKNLTCCRACGTRG